MYVMYTGLYNVVYKWSRQRRYERLQASLFPEGNLSAPISHPPSPGTLVVMVTMAKLHTGLSPWPHTVCGNAHTRHQICFSLGAGLPTWPGDRTSMRCDRDTSWDSETAAHTQRHSIQLLTDWKPRQRT